MRAAAVAFFATLTLAVAWAGPASAADVHVTTSTFKTSFSNAKAGDVLYLAAGNYGTFTGGTKTGMVTIKPESGASVSMSLDFSPSAFITVDGLTLTGVDIGDSRTHDITIKNSNVTGQTTLHTGELANAKILLDHNVHANWDKCNGCNEARVWLPENTSQPSGITIQNSQFGPGGLSDGIQNGSNGTKILNNEFFDLEMGSVDGVHTDAIQLYGSKNTVIDGNYFHDVPDAIMGPDGTDHETITNNVFAADDKFDYPYAITLWSDTGSVIRHNTMLYGNCAFNLKCGLISLGAKSGDHTSTGTIIRDNIFTGIACCGDAGSAGYTADHNLVRQTVTGTANTNTAPTFAGGTHPTTFAGFALTSASAGRGAASDGTDLGVNTADGPGVSDPTGPPPTTPPPADTTAPDTTIASGPSGTIATASASFSFTSSESGSAFECRLDAGSWAACTSPKALSGLSNASHTFSVRATDAAGNTDASPASATFTVNVPAAPPADTTAPDTTITSGPSGLTNDATPSFTFTASEGGATFQCRFDSGSWAACTSPKASNALADGSHTFAVRAADAAGNRDASPAARTFSIDTKAPNTTITSAPSGIVLGDSTVAAFEGDEDGVTFACSLDGGAWFACSSPHRSDDLAVGQHTLAVKATDAAGNVEQTPASAAWTTAAVTLPDDPVGPVTPTDPPSTDPDPGTPDDPGAPDTPTTPTTPHGPTKPNSPTKPKIKVPRNVTVRNGRFAISCSSACKVTATVKKGNRTVTVASGPGTRIQLTPAGKAALKSAKDGLKVTVAIIMGSRFQRTTTTLTDA